MWVIKLSNYWACWSVNLYLAIITSFRLQFWSLGILCKVPSLLKYFLDLAPLKANFLGNLPKSSIICAKWSSFLPKVSELSFLGLNNNSPVSISNVIQANDHMSADKLYFDPVNTSGPRYWRVWISVAKWWCYQQALPKSAILTLNPSSSFGPLSSTSFVSKAEKSSFAVLDLPYFWDCYIYFFVSSISSSPFSWNFFIFLRIFLRWFLFKFSSFNLY